MSEPSTAVRIEIHVTFRKGTPFAYECDPGMIIEDWYPTDDDKIEISTNGRDFTTIDIDDATPVEWDDLDQMWIDA